MMAWVVLATSALIAVSFGNCKHIIFIDKHLAKNISKYYDDMGYMRPQYQLFNAVGSRFMRYCFCYPWIRRRSTSQSLTFKTFMWFNSLGYWGFISVLLFGALQKALLL
ncbi:hypothetical protein APB76_08060 [Vibrio bivalvicida]|uniref:Uncharacterized protein n=1 Tax=Vibrio bivalvicida TaxID=1276888 RepID=A0A177Y350_9VIBR|nr:hypothetical protein APB76_08060 [Vibrio bivalvicida]